MEGEMLAAGGDFGVAKGKYQYWLTEEGLLLLQGWARDGLTDEAIAKKMKISSSTLYEYKKKYSEISEALKKGKEVVDIQVENALLKRALGFTYKEVVKERIPDSGQKKRHSNGVGLTEAQWKIVKNYFNNECCYCGKSGELTKDHIKPLIEGGELTMINVLPCCKSCNSSKKDHEMLSWYQKQPFYSKERAKRIYDYVSFAGSIMGVFEERENYLVVTKEIEKTALPDTTAQIFWLKNRMPDKWRDKVETASVDKPDNEIKINIVSTKTQKPLDI